MKQLGRISWTIVIDYDTSSDINGLYNAVESLTISGGNIFFFISIIIIIIIQEFNSKKLLSNYIYNQLSSKLIEQLDLSKTICWIHTQGLNRNSSAQIVSSYNVEEYKIKVQQPVQSALQLMGQKLKVNRYIIL